MERLKSIFTLAVTMGRQMQDIAMSHIHKIHAGFQCLEAHHQSKAYHAVKCVGLLGIFASSMLSLNIEGAIASGIGIGDEVTYLEKLPSHSPGRDIS